MTIKQINAYEAHWFNKPFDVYIPEVDDKVFQYPEYTLNERRKTGENIDKVVRQYRRGLITKDEAFKLVMQYACALGNGYLMFEIRKIIKSML